MADSLTLFFPGTGAADHLWEHIGTPGVRGSACMLLNGHILLDAGVTAAIQLERFGIAPDQLTDLLVTHTHIDHFDPEAIAKILAARSPDTPPLAIRCSPEGAEILQKTLPSVSACSISAIRPGDTFGLADMEVKVLPSNHRIAERPEEETMWFLCHTPRGNLLYALDGAWLTTRAAEALKGIALDWAVWDCTVHAAGDWRSFEHNDLCMLEMILQALRPRGTVTDKTVHILTHFARTLWPDEETTRKIVEDEHGKVMARDGLKLEF